MSTLNPRFSLRNANLFVALNFLFSSFACAEQARILQDGKTATFTFSEKRQNASDFGLDFKNAKPMPLPVRKSLLPADAANNSVPIGASELLPGNSPGSVGTGKTRKIQLIPPSDPGPDSTSDVTAAGNFGPLSPQEFGSAQQVYTTSRIDPSGVSILARFYPFSAAGKLFFNKGTDSFVCSAALIKPGVVVTAAHCLVDWGKQRVYSDFVFVPGYYNGAAPFGTWTVSGGSVLESYFTGIEINCTPDGQGVVCNNDVGVLVLKAQNTGGISQWAGDLAGWMGYSWNGWEYNSEYQALISQLGYPSNLDGGQLMQRTDSQGFVDFSQRANTIIGSLQTGGSSGGPWVVNLGIQPNLNNTNFGAQANHNTVVAVTSWGHVDDGIKQQGASSFSSNNIVPLINKVCPTDTGPCHP